MKRRVWMPALAVLIVLGAGAAWWRAGSEADQPRYRTAPIERGALVASVASTGTVNPVRQVSVGSQISGQIKEMLADFNTEVKRGQLIARLDPQTYEYRVNQATADLESARAAVINAQANVTAVSASVSKARLDADNAQRDATRKQELLAREFISKAEADNARNLAATQAEALKVALAQLEVAKAQVVSAQAVVRQREAAQSQARVDLERTEIRSPVDGVVIKRSVDVGQTVAASLQAPELFIIARSLAEMQVEAAIDEADISRIRPQQKVGFTVDAFPGRSFEGRVGQIRKAALSQQNVVTYTVVVEFANTGSLLLPGMTANVRIVTDQRDNVLKVPNAALRVRIPGHEAGPAAAPAVAALLPSAQAQTPAAPGGGSGAMADLRKRLVEELQLTPEQTAKVDAVFAATRPRFAELRTLPEEERGKARERIVAELRSRIAEQLTPAQQQKYQQIVAESAGRAPSRGRVYTLDSKGQPVAHDVRLGITDGVATELIVPADSPLKEGTAVVTGLVRAAAAARSPGATAARPPMF